MKTISSKLQIILIMMIFIVPLIGLLIGYNVYNVNTLNQRVAQNNENSLLLYRQSTQRELRDVESYMANFLANDSDCLQLRYPVSVLKSHMLWANIQENYRSLIETKKEAAGIFLYSRQNSLFRAAYNRSYTYGEKEEMEKYLMETIHDSPDCIQWGWFFRYVRQRPMLFRILGSNGAYSMCAFDLDYVEFPQDLSGTDDSSFFFFLGPDGTPITEQARLKQEKISVLPSNGEYVITGQPNNRYFLVQKEMSYAGITLASASPYQGLLMNMDNIQITIFVASVIILLLIIFSFLFLKRFYLKPLDSLVRTMELVRSGQLEAKVKSDYPTDEFQRLGSTFNAMMDEIRLLKIASYEQQLEIQQAELQYLKIQIRPHFFLNCLKNLYALAQEKKYEKAQGMILRLSEYLRFLVQDDRTLISLERETKNVENYISLQQMCVSRPPVCTIQVDEKLVGLRLPPLSVLTFVENSIKHGMVPGKELDIHVRISLLEGEEGNYVSLLIRDNGKGFSTEMLEQLNRGESGGPQHVGIQNVCRRFRLIYGGNSTFLFSNRGGAETEIFFPYLPGHREEQERMGDGR